MNKKFTISRDYDGCIKIYNSLTTQEKEWYGSLSDGLKFLVHRKILYVNGQPAAVCEVTDAGKCLDGISGDCVVSIMVHSNYRKQGLGYQLVSEVINSFLDNGFKSLTYRVNQDNIASILLAEKCGLIRLPQEILYENIRDTEYVYITTRGVLKKKGRLTMYESLKQDIERMDIASIAEIEKIIIEHDKIEEDIMRLMGDTRHPQDWETAAYVVSKKYNGNQKVWEIMRQLRSDTVT